MDQAFSQLIDDAAKIATSGRWNALTDRLKEMADSPAPDNVWFVQLFMALCSKVFSEYLLLKQAYEEGNAKDVSLLAWRARNLMELSIWAVYCARSRKNARRLYEDAGRDVTGGFGAFKKWGEATAQDAEWFASGVTALQSLSNSAQAAGIESLTGSFVEVREAVKQTGFEHHFKLYNKFLSKFCHPTAIQILSTPDEAMQAVLRDTFFSQGCLFFTGAFTALEQYHAS